MTILTVRKLPNVPMLHVRLTPTKKPKKKIDGKSKQLAGPRKAQDIYWFVGALKAVWELHSITPTYREDEQPC